LRICGAGIFIVAAAQVALAGSGPARSSGATKKPDASSAAHRSASAAHRRHATRPPAHQATGPKQHKSLGSRPAASSSVGAADKSLDQQPVSGPFSLGLETEQKVKRRSIRGGEYDPERDGDDTKGFRPHFLGFSLKAPLSW